MEPGEFPGGPVVRTPHFHCRGAGSIPGQETKILHAWDQAGTLVNKADAGVRGPPSSHHIPQNRTLAYNGAVAIAETNRR